MLKAAAMALLATAGIMLAMTESSHAKEGSIDMEALTKTLTAPAKSGHHEINGVNYYYEVRGEGEPLLLLHGGLGSTGMFEPVLPALLASRQVIGVDLQGHGRTTLGDRPMSMEAMGDDMATLTKRLGYGQVDAMGYSFGGGVALRMAVQHPQSVRRLVIASAPFARDGFYPEILEMQAHVGAGMMEMMRDTPMFRSYSAVAPKVEDFPKLLDAMGALMVKPYDWSADIPGLKMPVMLMFGDSDMFRMDHIVQFYRLLGGGLKDAGWMRENMARNRLAILPDLTHYELFAAPALVRTALPFLNGQSVTKSWAEQIAK